MIGRLSGILAFGEDGMVMIDVGGIGYLVRVSATLRAHLGNDGDAITLLIDTQMRENALELYGFAKEEERRAFRLVISVQGVGAKLALSLLSAMTVEELHTAIAAKDRQALTTVPGVGGRLAARIATELADKVEVSIPVADAQEAGNTVFADALSALCNLGYERGKAWRALRQARADMSADRSDTTPALENLVPAALKVLST